MFSDRVREIRIARGLSQVQLAKKLGVTKQTISNWENGNILPSIDMIIKISEFFRLSTDYLLGLDSRTYIETTGLNLNQVGHIQQIIDDIVNNK